MSTEKSWILWYEDKGVIPEFFCGEGAEAAARQRFKQARDHWSCGLFVQVADSTKVDDQLAV